MREGIQWVLDNCTSYEVAQKLIINNRTVNRYQNGESPIENMSFGTAEKLYNYYIEEMTIRIEYVYEAALERVKKNEMSNEGIYFDFYASATEFENLTKMNLGEFLKERLYSQILADDTKPFIILGDLNDTDGQLYTRGDTANDIIDFMKSEPSYKKYVKEMVS